MRSTLQRISVEPQAEQMATTLIAKFFTRLARLSHYSPKGRSRLALFFLRFASNEYVTPSIYGPIFQTRWHDATFRFCISGMYGKYLSEFLRRLSYPFSFVDIGANIGLYSLIAASNPNCKNCYAFEPNPTVFDSLKKNLKINELNSIHAYNCAISDKEGVLHFATTEAHSGIGRLIDRDTDGSITVKSVDKKIFDEIAATDRLPKIVKIDVEGHEPVVIGELMKSSIWNDIHYLYFEANCDRYDVGRLVDYIEGNGLAKIHQKDQGGDLNLMFARLSNAN